MRKAIAHSCARGPIFARGGLILAAIFGPGGPLLVGDRISRDRSHVQPFSIAIQTSRDFTNLLWPI